MWKGCDVWASSLMPLGAEVVEEEWRMIAKIGVGGGGGGGGEGIKGAT